MTTRTAVLIVLAIALLFGAVDTFFVARGLPTPRPVELLLSAVAMVTGYVWYRRDAAATGYRGSVYLGAAIAIFALAAVPYYLYRSRPSGARRRSILRFFGLLLLAVLVSAVIPVAYETLHAG